MQKLILHGNNLILQIRVI